MAFDHKKILGKKIKIIQPVPVDSHHGINVNSVFEIVDPPVGKTCGIWIESKLGEKVRVFPREIEWVD